MPLLRRIPHGRRSDRQIVAALCWLLGACLAFSLSGLPSALHLLLVPHGWCELHHRLEHLDAGRSAQKAVGRASDQSNALPGDGVDPSSGHQGCFVALYQPPVQPADAWTGPDTVVPRRAQAGLAAATAQPSRSILALAPKRSPPHGS